MRTCCQFFRRIPVLTHQQRSQIRVEELFRAEVRRTLETQPDSPSPIRRLLKFLNTTLGIWLLSTVAVGTLSWSYGQFRDRNAEHDHTAEVVKRLDAEIGNRLADYRRRVEAARDTAELRIAIEQLDAYRSLFPEYRQRTFVSLIWELHSATRGTQRFEIYSALRAAWRLHEMIVPHLSKLGPADFSVEQHR